MRFVIQRVQYAEVTVENENIASIQKGFLVFVGVSATDTKEIAEKMVQKLINLRIFEDESGKTNLSLQSVSGELLIVSQFTLYADCKKGNRPSFTKSGAPDMAEELYEYIIEQCAKEIPKTACGKFGANMKISLLNDGPFTILLDSDEIVSAH